MNWLYRAALRLLPQSWRDAVRSDLEEEARGRGRGEAWAAWQVLKIAPSMIAVSAAALATDFRYACRSLIRARWFTVGAVLTFAIGVAAAIAVLTAVDRALFRPLPYANPDRVFLMTHVTPPAGGPLGIPGIVLDELRRRETSVQSVALVSETTWFYETADVGDGAAFRLARSSVDVLDVLGVRVVRGRGFEPADLRSTTAVTVLTHEAWQRRFGGGDVIGRRLWAHEGDADIIGILPRGFVAPSLFARVSDGLVLATALERAADREKVQSPFPPRTLTAVARLRPEIRPHVAEQELTAFAQAVGAAHPDAVGGAIGRVQLRDIRTVLFGQYRTYLWLVSAAAAVVLLLCCVNLAMLLLARGRAREPMAALQTALGASRGRVIALTLAESALVCGAGAAIALSIVAVTANLTIAVLPDVFSRFDADWFDPRIVGITITITLITAVVAGLGPALRASRADATSLLQAGAIHGRRRRHFAAMLILGEASLGVLLVSGAATSVRSFVRVSNVDLGFEPEGLFRLSIRLPPRTRMDPAVLEEALQLLRLSPGVQNATGAPWMFIAGIGPPFAAGSPLCCRTEVSERYLATFGIPVVAGRDFTATELSAQAPVAMLSLTAAGVLFPNAAPSEVVGQLLQLPGDTPRRIIGIVGDVRESHADRGVLSLLVPRSPGTRMQVIVARAQPGRTPDLALLRSRLRERSGPGAAVSLESLTSVHFLGYRSVQDHRFRAVLLGIFGAIALAAAVVGLYAVAAFDATMRLREMSIRMTLGASAADVRRLIVRGITVPVVAGIAVGLVVAWWVGQFGQAFLFEIDARDPMTAVSVGAAFLTTALTTAWVAARRATSADPAVVLKAT